MSRPTMVVKQTQVPAGSELPSGAPMSPEADSKMDEIFGNGVIPLGDEPGGEDAPDPKPDAGPDASDEDLMGPDLGVPAQLVPKPEPEAIVEPPPPADDATLQDEATLKKLTGKDKEAFIYKTHQIKEWKTKHKEVQDKLKEAETKVKDLETQVTIAKAAPVAHDLAKTNELEAKLKDYEEKLGKYELSATDSFQKSYDVPMQTLELKAAKLLVTSERPLEEAKILAQKLLASAGDREALVELLSDEPVSHQGALVNLANDYLEVVENRKLAIDNWRASRAAVEEEQKRTSKARLVQNVVQATSEAQQDLLAEGNILLQKVDGNEEWNKLVDTHITTAQGVLHQGDPKLISKLVLDGITAGAQRELYRKLLAAYNNLRTQSAKILGKRPAVGAGAPSSQPAARPVETPKSGDEALNQVWGPEST